MWKLLLTWLICALVCTCCLVLWTSGRVALASAVRLACTQVTDVVEDGAKLKWLTDRLPAFIDQGDVLVFASQKLRVDELTGKLKAGGFRWCSHDHAP